MRKKFAALLVNVIKSCKEQNVEPTLLTFAVLALTEYDDPVIGKPHSTKDSYVVRLGLRGHAV